SRNNNNSNNKQDNQVQEPGKVEENQDQTPEVTDNQRILEATEIEEVATMKHILNQEVICEEVQNDPVISKNTKLQHKQTKN
ncbi:1198_t:CDS:1, partial [Cetraspora pellucida]